MAGPTREVLYEVRRVGNAVKVSALDAASGTEISIVGPAGASMADLKRAALRRLEYVLAKSRESGR